MSVSLSTPEMICKITTNGIFLPDDLTRIHRIVGDVYVIPVGWGDKEFDAKLEALIEEHFLPIEHVEVISFDKDA